MSDDQAADHAADQRRQRLAAAQRGLLAALVAGGPLPDGFDPVRLRIEAAGLIAKRRGLVARSAPDLAIRLGPRFAALFTEYAERHPKPPGGSLGDARAFADWLGLPLDPPPAGPPPGRWARFLRRRPTS
ncbi:hypothetical protein [Nonomuraea guangzhouensis]|uniref:SCO6045-like C-terminal domain-containing protein n=1 Tax=Nonomuraea guangzhouensis TaxID=1291555 RepID=A0ABW4GUH2_9ACTN|nr:hypothetical protein [Nonomuraea guangzhouensis]